MKPAVVGAIALLCACGPASIETIAAPPECPLPALEPPPAMGDGALLVDDLEDGDFLGKTDGALNAEWEFWYDGTQPNPQVAQVSNACAAVGRYALHLTSSDRHRDWGASASLFFREAPHPQPFDASEWNAISFYLASGRSQVPRNMRVSVSTMDTAWDGRCTSCVDNFGTSVPVTGRWQRFVVRFSEARQVGWGVPQVAFNPAELVQLHVELNQAYDVWVDHVRLERLPPL